MILNFVDYNSTALIYVSCKRPVVAQPTTYNLQQWQVQLKVTLVNRILDSLFQNVTIRLGVLQGVLHLPF